MTIGIAATLLGAGTLSYFYDIETSSNNIFTAGKLDLKIDWDSYWYRYWPDPIMMGEKHQIMDDLTGENFFDWPDIKPGDWGEATISFHVFDNDAWGWLHFFDVFDHDNGLTEPEENHPPGCDTTGGDDEGELSQHIYTFLWVDDGMTPGWQGRYDLFEGDPGEGDNIWNYDEEVIFGEPYQEIATMYEMYMFDCCWLGPWYIENCETIYIGWYWWVPTWVGNIIQSDSFGFGVEFHVDQYRNNPTPVPPGPPCVGEADLEITKTVDNPRPYEGDLITYTLDVHNIGPSTATGIEVTDLLPAGVTYDSDDGGGAYDYMTGIWDVGSLDVCKHAMLNITVQVDPLGVTSEFTQLAFILDGSGSIDPDEWTIMKTGLAAAIRNPDCVPRGGLVEITVVQFGGSCAEIEVYPTIITDDASAEAVAVLVEGMVQNGGSTPMASGIYLAADALYNSPSFDPIYKQAVNIVTDGDPNVCMDAPGTYPGPYCGYSCDESLAKVSAVAARDYMLALLAMDPAQDEIDAEGVLSYGATPPDIPWLRDNIVWPSGVEWIPPDPPAGPGWVRYIDSWEGFADSICEKLGLILGIINTATITASSPTDPVPGNNQDSATINPLPE
jgi:uncharacterized repeat protein (TIGR01451 family)/predicted ribosomally synthesized peptide with SipW-like signal peptide